MAGSVTSVERKKSGPKNSCQDNTLTRVTANQDVVGQRRSCYECGKIYADRWSNLLLLLVAVVSATYLNRYIAREANLAHVVCKGYFSKSKGFFAFPMTLRPFATNMHLLGPGSNAPSADTEKGPALLRQLRQKRHRRGLCALAPSLSRTDLHLIAADPSTSNAETSLDAERTPTFSAIEPILLLTARRGVVDALLPHLSTAALAAVWLEGGAVSTSCGSATARYWVACVPVSRV